MPGADTFYVSWVAFQGLRDGRAAANSAFQPALLASDTFLFHQLDTNIQQRVYWYNFFRKRLEDFASSNFNIFYQESQMATLSPTPPTITTNPSMAFSTTGPQGLQSRNSTGQASRHGTHCQINWASNRLEAIFVKGKISCSWHWRIQKRQDYLDSSEGVREAGWGKKHVLRRHAKKDFTNN